MSANANGMSAAAGPDVAPQAQASDHGHGHGSDHVDGGAAHGSHRSYVTGFVLSVILTAIPFGLVMSGAIADKSVVASAPLTLGLQLASRLLSARLLSR